MLKEKKPRIPMWKIVIVVLEINQAADAYHDYQIHHWFREQIYTVQEQHLNLMPQVNEYMDNLPIHCFQDIQQ